MKSNNLVGMLNNCLANLQTMYIKLHTYHWNVKGMNFRQVHELTESYYEYFAKQFDDCAERILQLGGKPLSSMKEYISVTKINEEVKKDFDAKFVLNSVLKDFETLNVELKKISKTAGDASDSPTVNFADENISWLEKEIWMIKASLA